MAEGLVFDVADLLTAAAESAVDEETADTLRDAAVRMDEPLRLAIAGKVKAGKSTLLNSLVGEELAPTDAGECTRIVTWYRLGDQPRVVIHPHARPPETRPYHRNGGAIDVDLGRWSATEIDHMDVWWPSRRLRELTIIDTPGLSSLSTDLSELTTHALAPSSGEPPVADAVVYLLRHAHSSDLRFLEEFHGDDLAKGTPMNGIGVLSRADEVGLARTDALDVAARVGARYRSDPRLHRLCPVIVPVAGLLAQAGATLREQEFRGLAAIAAVAETEATELMLTADRFVTRTRPGLPPPEQRRELLARMGLYGVRVATKLIRTGAVDNATALSSAFTDRSGITQLHDVLRSQFTDRSRILKARTGLAVLRYAIDNDRCRDAGALAARLEQVEASAHEFVEVRTLEALRAGDLAVSPDVFLDLEQLLGGSGHDPATRLGLESDAEAPQLNAAALEALAFWQRRAEHPMTGRQERSAARVAARSLEGILAELAS